jgi:hypothetical protein
MSLNVNKQIDLLRKQYPLPRYVSLNIFVGKTDLGDVANKMDEIGYDLTFIIQQANGALVTMLFRRSS